MFVSIPLVDLGLTDVRFYDVLMLLFLRHFRAFRALSLIGRGDRDFRRFKLMLIIGMLLVFLNLPFRTKLDLFDLLPLLVRAFRIFLFVFFIHRLMALMQSEKVFNIVLNTLFWSAVGTQFIVLGQVIGAIPVLWPSKWLYYVDSWRTGLLSPHHLQIGLYSIFTVFIVEYHTSESANPAKRLIGLFASAFAIYASFFNDSRTGMFLSLAMLSSASIITYLSLKRFRFANFLPLIAIIFAGIFFYEDLDLGSFFEEKYEENVTTQLEDRGTLSGGREMVLTELKSRLASLEDLRYWLGFGFDLYPGPGAAAHNNYFQILVEFGIWGLFIFVSHLYLSISNLLRYGIYNNKYNNLQAKLLFVFLSIFLVAMFYNEILYPTYIGFATFALVLLFFNPYSYKIWVRRDLIPEDERELFS